MTCCRAQWMNKYWDKRWVGSTQHSLTKSVFMPRYRKMLLFHGATSVGSNSSHYFVEGVGNTNKCPAEPPYASPGRLQAGATFHRGPFEDPSKSTQGWSCEVHFSISIYWLAHGQSYIVESWEKVVALRRGVIRLPNAGALDGVGQAFAWTANSPVFSRYVGATDGCHVHIRGPGLPQNVQNEHHAVLKKTWKLSS